jgi:hypothetical protein
VRRSVQLDVLGGNGRGYVAFWLYGTGCEPVRLSARMVGQASPSSRVGTIPFDCGE